MAEHVTGGAGRKDEVGRTGIYPATGPYPEGDAPIITPGEINSGSTGEGPRGHQDDDDLKPDDVENDSLGG
jgi:hypothetical protein